MLIAIAILFYTTWESSYYHDWKQQAKQGEIVFSNLDKSDPVYTDIIKSNCTSCHGGELTGGQGPNLVESKLPKDGVKGFVENGAGKMPSFKDTLSKDEIDKVAKYVADLHETDSNGKELKK